MTITPPFHMALILQSKEIHSTNLSNLRLFMCGGSAVSNELCIRMKEFLPNPVYVGYGLSEICGVAALAYPHPRMGSVGPLSNATSVKLIDPDGNRCGIDKDGEICIWLQHPFLGYYGNAQATADAFDKDGWVLSGDVGHFDQDGYLYIVDRLKDILKYRGNQISPSEIENRILEHRGVATVCVVGIPDLVSTDLPAAVVLRNDTVDVTEREISDIVKSKFWPFFMKILGFGTAVY